MTDQDEIASLKAQLQTAQTAADFWQGEAEAWEAQCKAQELERHTHLHIPWAVGDEIEMALRNGDSTYALRLWLREAQS